MSKHTLLTEAIGQAELPVADLRRALVDRFDDGYLHIDTSQTTVAVQGGWWYRGEYELQPHRTGTAVTLRVYNVASRGRWAVPLANKMFIGLSKATQVGLNQLLHELDARRAGPERRGP